MAQPPVIYLLDASSYIHRAFHAIRNLATSDGVPTGAVYGFVQMLLKVMKDADPKYLAVVYDTKAPTFRHKLYDQYKANRPPLDPTLKAQFPLVRQVVTALNLPAVEMAGFEADDLMATLAARAREKGFEVVLVTGDKDMFQLVGPGVSMWDTMKELHLGVDEVREKLGIDPGQVVDYMALTGDASDNVPGVKGIGPKTAQKLISKHGDLDTLLAAAPDMKKSKMRQNLIEQKDQALLSRELVRLDSNAPLPFDPQAFAVEEPDPEVITPVLARLEFNRLLAQFAPQPVAGEGQYQMVTEPGELKEIIARAEQAGFVAVDTETTSLTAISADLVGFSLSVEPGVAVYAPLGHDLSQGQTQADKDEMMPLLAGLLADAKVTKIGQNLKYDINVLDRAGLEFKGPIFDTMVASYLLNPGRSSHGLAALAAEFLGRSVISYQQATGGKNLPFAGTPLSDATEYAAEDADVTLQLWEHLGPMLQKAGLSHLASELEMPLVAVLAKIERNGVGLDSEVLNELSKELGGKIEDIKDRCYELAGKEFNLNSPKQLGQVLFEDLGLRQIKKTKKKTGYSTDVSVLTILAQDHPLPAQLLEYRTLSKLKGTYVDTLPALVNPETGRLHTNFNQAVTATGRLSSSDPNLQNIPVRSEVGGRIRACFIPGPGKLLVSADYSQVELRVLAHLSEDELLLSDLGAGLDVHTQTASRLFEVEPDEVTVDMRRRAKTVNFGVLYGMSAFRLAREQGISNSEAQDIIERYLGRYAGIARFQQENLSQARELGYVTTLLGRRRFLPAINSRDRLARQSAERMALNTPIQGTAADIIKLAMLRCDEMLLAEYPDALMTLQVHDELVFECPWQAVEPFAQRVREVMEQVIKLKVDLAVDVGWGQNWAQAH